MIQVPSSNIQALGCWLQNPRSNAQVIRAQVPLATMFGYVNTLRSLTQGRAQFTMEFNYYQQVPAAVSEEVRTKFA